MKFLEKPLFWIVFVAIAFTAPLARTLMLKQPETPPILARVPNFSLVDQDKRPTTLESFRGSVVVTNFIFTSCPGVCPMLTKQMGLLQNRLKSIGPTVKLLSISVDPTTDTPEVLKNYGDKYGANYRIWTFLTGTYSDIESLVMGGFKVGLDKAKPGTVAADADMMDITHSEHFVIFDQIGQIRSYRMANNEQDLNEIIKDIAIIANSDPTRAPTPAR